MDATSQDRAQYRGLATVRDRPRTPPEPGEPLSRRRSVNLGFERAAALSLAGVLVVALVVAGLLLTRGPRTARIVDCAPGYHNVAGPASDCVPN